MKGLKKLLRRAVIGIGLTGILGFGGYKAAEFGSKASVRSWVDCNLVKVMSAQEEELGITYTSIPNISFDLSRTKTRLPKDSYHGVFNREENTIYLNDEGCVSPDRGLAGIIYSLFNPSAANVEEILNHELGHVYVSQIAPQIGRTTFPLASPLNPFERASATREHIVSEGIAEYFAGKMLGNKTFRNGESWPENELEVVVFGPDHDLTYQGGFDLVKPIIDKFGDRGIRKLIEQPPLLLTKDHLREYQRIIIDALGRKK